MITDDGVPGIIYLLHFHEPVSNHARHYTGWTTNLAARLAAHATGYAGARLMEVVHERDIAWSVALTVRGTRNQERSRKNSTASRRCPLCHGRPPRYADGAVPPAQYVPQFAT